MNDYEHQAVPPPAPSAVSQDDRLWAAGTHIAALLAAFFTSWFAGIAGALAALVIWFIVRDRSSFAAENAKEAFNFNLSMFLYAVVSVLVVVFTLGIGLLVALPAWLVLGLVWLIFTIIAAMKAYGGELYRYPLTIRLLK